MSSGNAGVHPTFPLCQPIFARIIEGYVQNYSGYVQNVLLVLVLRPIYFCVVA